eukprot:410051-Pelagomonas_calceolata.AAC.2
MNGWDSLHGAHLAMHTRMHKQGMACWKVPLLPQALHINATSVPGRTGFVDFAACNASLTCRGEATQVGLQMKT